MFKRHFVTHLCLGAVSAVLVVGHAQATPVTPNGSLSGALIGGAVNTTSAGGSAWRLGITTSQIQVTSGLRLISGDADPYLSKPDNLLVANGGVVTVGDPFTISNSLYNIASGPITPFNVSVDGLTFTLTKEVVTSVENGNIGLAFIGSVTGDTTGHYTLGESSDFSIGLTESSPTVAIGVGYSIDAPANPALVPVPEPATLSLLGMGVLGLVGTRRKIQAPSLATPGRC
jgi:hypothetical protein